MKKLNLFKNCAAVTTFFFLIASTSFAQLKLGNNPTTLGTNNNLEVEGTNSKKVAVKSDTGQLIVGSSNTSVPTGGANAAVIIDNGTTNGAIQIKDGTQGLGKVLTSDGNGLATWLSSSSQVIYGNIVPTSQLDVSNGFLYDDNTNNLSIDLPPGIWIVNFYNQIQNTLSVYNYSVAAMNVAIYRDDEPFLTQWPLCVSSCNNVSSSSYFHPRTQCFINNNTAITHRYRLTFNDSFTFGGNSSNNKGVLQGNAIGSFGYFYANRLSQ